MKSEEEESLQATNLEGCTSYFLVRLAQREPCPPVVAKTSALKRKAGVLRHDGESRDRVLAVVFDDRADLWCQQELQSAEQTLVALLAKQCPVSCSKAQVSSDKRRSRLVRVGEERLGRRHEVGPVLALLLEVSVNRSIVRGSDASQVSAARPLSPASAASRSEACSFPRTRWTLCPCLHRRGERQVRACR